MSLLSYAQFVAVTAIFAFLVLALSLTFKSWLDRRMLKSTLTYANTINKDMLDAMYRGEFEDDSFDDHVQTTPGMTNINLN